MNSAPVRVLVVDDAAFMRRSVIKLLSKESDIEVVGEAADGREAVECFRRLAPDVICLDIDMPNMDGITAIKHIMALRPTPIVIISSMTDRYDVPFEVLRLGAVGFFPKPSSLQKDTEEQIRHLLYMVRSARLVREGNLHRVACRRVDGDAGRAGRGRCRHLLAIGGTLGSVGPLLRIFSNLPADLDPGACVLFAVPLLPPITESFLESMGNVFGWEVVLADGRRELRSGVAYFLPSGVRAVVEDGQLIAESGENGENGGDESRLDDLFAAASEAFGKESTVVLLAGDRDEGVAGIKAAADRSAQAYIQDESSALFTSWAPDAPGQVACFDLDHIVEALRDDLAGASQ